jgi:UDPglucose 6-dehydrogenase/GDP-mannose 6-dehydrogenase
VEVSIIGTGYVGLVTGACLATVGHTVTCVDQVASRVETISGGLAPFFEPGLQELVTETVAAGRLSATSDLAGAVRSSEVTLIAVGTPDKDGEIDLSQIETAAKAIGAAIRGTEAYHVIAVKSTVVPGTTGGIVLRNLEEGSGKRAGADFGLCMNPEFLREGSAVEDFMHPDRIVVGAHDARSGDVFNRLYAMFDCPKPIVSLGNAEFIKYASNAFLATTISFANELAGLCEAIPGVDAEVVLDGLHLDKRLSPVLNGTRIRPGILNYLRPSSGYGGSCFPKDVTALRAFARERGLPAPLLDAVAEVNALRNNTVLTMAEERIGALAGRRVAVLGLAFKAGTDDLRHSPAIELVNGLLARGATVAVHDPVATDLARPILGDQVIYAADPMAAVEGADVVVIGAGWPQWRELDWSRVSRVMRGSIVFDARNSLRDFPLPDSLTRLGIGTGPPAISN